MEDTGLGANPRSGGRGAAGELGARELTLALAAGRIAIGLGLALAPGPAMRALGFADASDQTVLVSRLAGGRDIVLGMVTLLARDDAGRLAAASLANAAVDAGDAAAFGAALEAGPGVRAAAIRGLAAAAPAALAGAWLALRLRRGRVS